MLTYSLVSILLLIVLNCAIAIRLNLRSRSQVVQKASSTQEGNTRRVTIVVLVISSTYATINCHSVLFVLLSIIGVGDVFSDPEVNDLMDAVVHEMLMLNHAFNFWLYLATSSSFRGSLRALFTPKKAAKPSSVETRSSNVQEE
jgi:hypothetical protein